MDDATSLATEMARAENFKNAGRLAEAAEIYRQVCSNSPDNVEAHLQLGLISWDLQQPDEAIDFLKRAAEMDPSSPVPHNGLSEIHFAFGRLEDADQILPVVCRQVPGRNKNLNRADNVFDALLDRGMNTCVEDWGGSVHWRRGKWLILTAHEERSCCDEDGGRFHSSAPCGVSRHESRGSATA